MQKDHKFFDDLAKLASNAGGTLLEMKREMEAMVSTQTEKILRRMDLVTKDEFTAVRDMAAKARTEQEKLEKRIIELEKKLGVKPVTAKTPDEPAKTGTTGKKTTAKKAASKPAAKKAAPAKTGTTGRKAAARKPARKPAKKTS